MVGLSLDAAYFQIKDIPFTKGNKKKKGENGFLFFLFIYPTFDYFC